MHLAVTIRRDEDDLDEIKSLITELRKYLGPEELVVRKAPNTFDYPFQFPLVIVSDGPSQGRHFGSEATEVLRDLSKTRQSVGE